MSTRYATILFSRLGLVVLTVLPSITSKATEYSWKANGRLNDWDWTDSRNFVLSGTSTEGTPQSGDVVLVPAGLTVYARTSDADSFARASSLEQIKPLGAGACVVFDVGEGQEKELGCAINAWTGYTSNSRGMGGFAKTGTGTLVLSRNGRNYYTSVDLREGVMKLAASASTYFLEYLAISNGATFYANPGGYTSTGRLYGSGVITNTSSQVFQLDEKDMQSSFSGVIAQGIYFYTGGSIDLLSPVNMMNNLTVRYNEGKGAAGPMAGLKKLGFTSGGGSSAGNYQNIFMSDGGYIRYLGDGETTDKYLYINYSKDYPSYIDGGENGALKMTGGITFNSYMHRFVFTGDHTSPCEFSGAINLPGSGSTNYTVYITKSGTGTWRFKDNSYRYNAGGIAVEDGTLQFDSIDEAGRKTSLGYATMLYENYSGAMVEPARKVPYAYVLGSAASADGGLMEYMGTKSARVTTRPAVVDGKGGFKVSAGALRFANVSAKGAGGGTLVLDGSGEDNEIQDVADGAGVVSVVKRGSGTWHMSGSNTFSGMLDVQAGTLHVRSPSRYRWYRLNVKKLYNKNSSGDKSADGYFLIWVLGLYDASGNRINPSMTQGGDALNLLSGEAGNGSADNTWEPYYEYGTGTYGYITNMFIDSTANSSRFHVRSKNTSGTVLEPDPENEATWGRVVMRVADDTPDVDSWDFVQSGYYNWGSPYNVTAWSLDGSTDGLRWDELTPDTTARGLWGSSGNGQYTFFWYYGREKWESGSADNHATGEKIRTTKANPLPCLNNVSAVSVASGAVLYTDDSAGIPIKGLHIDANGMGTISNFTFAAQGQIDVVNVAAGSGVQMLPGTFSNVGGLANVENWNLSVNGRSGGRSRVAVTADGKSLRLIRPGIVVSFK